MNKIVSIDTNIIIRFLIQDNYKFDKESRKIFEKIANKEIKVYLNDLVLAECTYVLESFYKFKKSIISENLTKILIEDNVLCDNKNLLLESLELYKDKNIDFEDAYTYCKSKSKNIDKIITFDKKHFSKLNIEIV